MSGIGRNDQVSILVGWAMADALLERIASADSRVRLLNREIAPLPAPTQLWPPFPEELLPLVPEARGAVDAASAARRAGVDAQPEVDSFAGGGD